MNTTPQQPQPRRIERRRNPRLLCGQQLLCSVRTHPESKDLPLTTTSIIESDGLVHNLSVSGCMVETPQSYLRKEPIEVILITPDTKKIIHIPAAHVRWTMAGRIGIHFKVLTKEAETQLLVLLQLFAHHL